MLVVGTMAFDSIEAPSGSVDRILGGSGTFSSFAASFFTKPKLTSIVGHDFPQSFREILLNRGVDLSGVQTMKEGKTFFWKGKYHEDMNTRDTLEVHLNVLAEFDPVLPTSYQESTHLFLANSSPQVQMKVIEQVKNPKLILADTMDFWIQSEHDALMQLLKQIDGLLLNDSEAKLLTGLDHLIPAAEAIRKLGPSFVVIKKGEHGSMLCSKDGVFAIPAYPTSQVKDPTGAGDSFAGALVGYLAEQKEYHPGQLRRAMAYGTVMASLTVESFGLDRLQSISREELDTRLFSYREMLNF